MLFEYWEPAFVQLALLFVCVRSKVQIMHTFLRYSEQFTDNRNLNKFDFDVFLCSIFAFTLPVTNFSINILNTRIEPQRFMVSLCILRLIIQLILPSAKEIKRHKLAFLLFCPVLLTIIYALFITALQPEVIRSIRAATDREIYSFILKRASKYLSYVAFSVYLALVLKTEKKIHTVVCSLAAALCVAEILGMLQSLVFLISGFDLFPINRTSLSEGYTTNFNQSVVVNFLDLRFLRINSLAHEPKALGVFITFLFFMKLYWSQYRQEYSSKTVPLIDSYMSRILWSSVVVILLTFSGSGLISLLFGLTIIIFISAKKKLYLKANSLIYFTLATVMVLLLFIFVETLPDKIDSFLQASLLRRLAQFSADLSIDSFYASVDPEDGAILYNVLNYPSVLISGLGFGAYSNISFTYFSKYYSQGFSPFSRNILVETIFSVGIPGIIVLSGFYYKLNFKFICGKYSCAKYIQLMLNHFVLINFFIRASEPIFFTTLGILAAVYLNGAYISRMQRVEL